MRDDQSGNEPDHRSQRDHGFRTVLGQGHAPRSFQPDRARQRYRDQTTSGGEPSGKGLAQRIFEGPDHRFNQPPPMVEATEPVKTLIMAGDRMTMNSTGRKKMIRGTVSLGGRAAAFFSASIMRASRPSSAMTRSA